MTISLVLHVESGDLLLFEGSALDCPPIPRAGDEIVHDTHRVRLEGFNIHTAKSTCRYRCLPEAGDFWSAVDELSPAADALNDASGFGSHDLGEVANQNLYRKTMILGENVCKHSTNLSHRSAHRG